jgi:hypothetical protein
MDRRDRARHAGRSDHGAAPCAAHWTSSRVGLRLWAGGQVGRGAERLAHPAQSFVSSTTPTIWYMGRGAPGGSSIWKEARRGSRPARYFVRRTSRLTMATGVETSPFALVEVAAGHERACPACFEVAGADALKLG